jgi:glycosyltransferase involved in cell wall biosynthesis
VSVRVALVTHQFFPRYYTGVERLTLNLTQQLQRMGHQCAVLTSAAHSSGSTESYAYEGVWVRPIERMMLVDPTHPWLDEPRLAQELDDMLDHEGVEIVHIMQPLRLPLVFDVARRRGLPVVAHVPDFTYLCPRINLLRPDGSRCDDADEGRACVTACGIMNGPDRYEWGVRVLAGADAVVSPCRASIDMYSSQGFDTETWHHIPWGVDWALHENPLPPRGDDRLRIGFIGTLLRHKGPHVLVEAVRLLEGRDIELVLYGESFHEGDYERELRKRAAGDSRIRFAGSYDHASFREVLAPLDVVAIPSLWHENLPTTGLNAIAAGVPLVVSDVPGLTELIDDYDCGFAFGAGDAGSLAELLARFLAEPELLREVRERIVQPAGVEEEAWRIESVYGEVLDNRTAAV